MGLYDNPTITRAATAMAKGHPQAGNRHFLRGLTAATAFVGPTAPREEFFTFAEAYAATAMDGSRRATDDPREAGVAAVEALRAERRQDQ